MMLSKWYAAPAPIWTRVVVRLVKVMRGEANFPLVTTIGRLVKTQCGLDLGAAETVQRIQGRGVRFRRRPGVGGLRERRGQGDEYDRERELRRAASGDSKGANPTRGSPLHTVSAKLGVW